MALSTATITFDLHQLLGADFDPRRTKAYVVTNVANDTLMDTSTGETRLGDQAVTINADGTGSWTTWVPGADGNPASWQETLVVDYARTGQRDRKIRRFGPYTIAGDAALTALEEEQAVPPTYLSTVTAQLDAKVDEAEAERVAAEVARVGAEAARDLAVDISGIDTTDAAVTTAFQIPGSTSGAYLSATIAEGVAPTQAAVANAAALVRPPTSDVKLKVTGANYSIDSATFVAVDSTGAIDRRVPAKPGDRLTLAFNCVVDAGPGLIRFTAFTMVAGSPVSNIANDPGLTDGSVTGWSKPGGVFDFISGAAQYTVRPADIEDGFVTLRLYAKTQGGTREIGRTTQDPLLFDVTNLGGGYSWLMTTFTYDEFPDHEPYLYLMGSEDTVNWRLLNDGKPLFTSPSGLLHDPAIMLHTDGYYYVAYSSDYHSDHVKLVRSADLRVWQDWGNVTVPSATEVYAPEWYVEAGVVRLLLSVSYDSQVNFGLAYIEAINADLTAWGTPGWITGDFPQRAIDPFLVKVGSTYHLFYKNDGLDMTDDVKWVEHATSASMLSGYTVVQSLDHSGWGRYHEGPFVIQLDDGSWRIFMDNPGLNYADSPDLMDWTTLTPINQYPALPRMRHGSLIRT